jgi:hypothetical protein
VKNGEYSILADVRLATPIEIEGETGLANGFFQTVVTKSSSLVEAVKAAESAILAASQWEAFGKTTGWITRIEVDCADAEASACSSADSPTISGRIYYSDEDQQAPGRKWWKLW